MKTVILTHPDSDGMCAGAVALSRFPDASIFFTKPVSFYNDLNSCEADRIVISDIAIPRRDTTDIVALMQDRSKNTEIYYFDHHKIPEDAAQKLKNCLKAYVTGDASASELIYRYFQKEIPKERIWIAIYGAIADYEKDTEFVEERIRNWDARALYFEAATIVLGIKDRNFDDYRSKRLIVKTLAKGDNPSDIPGLVAAAKRVVNAEFDLYDIVKKVAKKSGDIGYVKDAHLFGFRGPTAKFAGTVTGSRVGLSVYDRRGDHLDITMRTGDPDIMLNEMAEDAGEAVGGSGGGHPQACGARIPIDAFEKFLKELNKLLVKNPRKE